MKSLAAWLRVVDKLSIIVGKSAALLAAPMVLCLVYEVFARYLFNAPTVWSYDITYMIYGAHYLLGAAFTYYLRGHIRIDVFYNMFSPRGRNVVDVIGNVFIIVPVTLVLAISAYTMADDAWISQEVSQYSPWAPVLWPVKWAMALGFALLFLQCVVDCLRSIILLVKGEEL